MAHFIKEESTLIIYAKKKERIKIKGFQKICKDLYKSKNSAGDTVNISNGIESHSFDAVKLIIVVRQK